MSPGADIKRPTASLAIIGVLGFAAGAWMTWQGLVARLSGSVPFLMGAPELWATLAASSGLALTPFDWPLVIIGASWWGATLGLWTGNKWGWPVTLVLALLSLLHAWEVTLMAAVVLVLLFMPSVRRWGLGK